jgi:type II restriction/modification system DNA methylase subunit YeeA
MGMHYTSVPNIMKVIEPLFLNELYEEFDNGKHQPQKLNNLLYRLSRIKIFDPACGSGNFLIIAYKELRQLEIKIIQRLEFLQQATSGFEEKQLALIPKAQQTLAAMFQKQLFSNIQLNQFYGIELDDFAHEVATLSLWLAQHQMNMQFKEVLGQGNPTLPLRESGNITHGNATRLNWEEVCPKRDGDEIYILGNPPYLGSSMQSSVQKADLAAVCKGFENYKNLDYIACWFVKGAVYIAGINAKYSFVSTNSICQGEQVGLLWPYIINKNLEISFAHQSFKWSNNAKSKAAVIVVIIGVRNKSSLPKFLINNTVRQEVKSINPYLTSGNSSFVFRRASPISNFPEMVKVIIRLMMEI